MTALAFNSEGFAVLLSGGAILPAGAIALSDEEETGIRAALARGATVQPNGAGWQIVEPVPPTEAELLAAERSRMVLTRLQFGLQSLAAGLMTAAEAEGFLGPRTVPQIGEDALLLIEDAGVRVVARMRLVGFERLERNDPFLVPFQAAVEWTDAQVDDFFRAGMLL